MNWWIAAWYLAASAAAFIAMCIDKARARSGGRRVSERTLHLLELIGGWPGSIAAMVFVRHKNRKWSYFTVTAIAAAAHGIGWAWWTVRR